MRKISVTRLADGSIAEVTIENVPAANVTADKGTVDSAKGLQFLQMLGNGGVAREKSFADGFVASLTGNELPVLLGSGCGAALQTLGSYCADRGLPLLVVDKEQDILAQTGLAGPNFSGQPSLSTPCSNQPVSESSVVDLSGPGEPVFITSSDSKKVLQLLTSWQERNGCLPLAPCLLPFYSRLDKEFYGEIRKSCEASRRFNFWEKAQYTKFEGHSTRILLLTSKYFLIGEIKAACERLGVECHLLQVPDVELGHTEFVEQLLEAVLSFKPDFVFTINHLGVDREGVLVNLLERLRLPLASWFVDNPMLVLSLYTRLVSPWTSIFTWDVDNIEALRGLGFEHVCYLPLGTDEHRFAPPSSGAFSRKEWLADVSFVGNSMVHKVEARKKSVVAPAALVDRLSELAAGFAASDERSISSYLNSEWPELFPLFEGIGMPEMKLGYEAMLTWEATRQYRLSCVSATFPFAPLIVGDDGWKGIIPSAVRWSYLSELNYYADLPKFYPLSSVNFNCTSKQMKGAVNQRVFDVPATGAFLLTDYRDQVENLFEPGKEIICYHSPEEAQELLAYYLDAPAERQKIALAARERVLREHTYEHRVTSLIATMKALYA